MSDGIRDLHLPLSEDEARSLELGTTVTVSGLLGGEDVLAALEEREGLGDVVFLPRAMFSVPDGRKELLTLDDLSVGDIAARLRRPVVLAEYMSEVWERIGVEQ